MSVAPVESRYVELLGRARAAAAILRKARLRPHLAVPYIEKAHEILDDFGLGPTPALDAVLPPVHIAPRQLEAIQALARGGSYHDVAKQMGVSDSTAKAHIRAAYEALGVSTGAHAVHVLHLHGQLEP